MKLNKSTEQAVYIVIILALQVNHHPLKSSLLAEILQVSDSYLKKILRKLVVAGIITSAASKDGGFQLKKHIKQISLFDVYTAVQGSETEINFTHIGYRLFDDQKHVQTAEQKIKHVLAKGQNQFYEELKHLSLAELLETYAIQDGAIDWQLKKPNDPH
ncbi:transcriptional regulator [Paucilactobacillus hokkaidonensis JCM 18461]|uniref:Transcriptional regulator n=2 Tax=Paucilactobacillus hokkaidonensis TaxID=1193095 RepID=A0A0A1H0R9_9LACO|nr:Rrf2 family transcriptional regulator [Paucilactobacillus hokkaidonensis]KRO08165.1 hypothetical protein IV59_GL001483 [Paucilactobacillus hokkaidonensis]BAP86301.1 transcriptional regulator [Paucilactobacillus hokkaidonensis JCM 18461]